jgi:hypothetical protein
MLGRRNDDPRAKRPRKSTADQRRIGSNVPTGRKLRSGQTRRSGDPPRSQRLRKAAPAGWIRARIGHAGICARGRVARPVETALEGATIAGRPGSCRSSGRRPAAEGLASYRLRRCVVHGDPVSWRQLRHARRQPAPFLPDSIFPSKYVSVTSSP